MLKAASIAAASLMVFYYDKILAMKIDSRFPNSRQIPENIQAFLHNEVSLLSEKMNLNPNQITLKLCVHGPIAASAGSLILWNHGYLILRPPQAFHRYQKLQKHFHSMFPQKKNFSPLQQ
eukprot:Sdes_comp24733_c0_seq1m22504